MPTNSRGCSRREHPWVYLFFSYHVIALQSCAWTTTFFSSKHAFPLCFAWMMCCIIHTVTLLMTFYLFIYFCYMFCLFGIHPISVPWCQRQFPAAWGVKQHGCPFQVCYFPPPALVSVMDVDIMHTFVVSYVLKTLLCNKCKLIWKCNVFNDTSPQFSAFYGASCAFRPLWSVQSNQQMEQIEHGHYQALSISSGGARWLEDSTGLWLEASSSPPC